MSTIRNRLEDILMNLHDAGNIEATVIASRDGLVIAYHLSYRFKPETFAALGATMSGAARRAIINLKKPIPDRIITESKDGDIIVMDVNQRVLLVVMTNDGANLGMVLIGIEDAVLKIKELMES
ncbi:MAG: roadblock/LC7 domain-containing protein [Candidatus Altiarchaeales archaeon]|nr:roadblock/LC7 domain-containing protein [Candidatus Altiarchaeales archaeon]